MKALGMIEVYGYLAAATAADSAVKAANVSLVKVIKVTGGLVLVMISGDVGAAKTAVNAAAIEAARVGKVASTHVIARPAAGIDKLIATMSADGLPAEKKQLTEEDLKGMTVADLRSLARELNLSNMTKQEIRFAKKQEIVSAITKNLKGEK